MTVRPRLRLALAGFCLGLVTLHLALYWVTRKTAAGLQDFRIFYTAGLMLRRGQGSVLYNSSLQLQTQREFVPGATARYSVLPYIHPPFEALVYVRLTYFPYARAFFLWVLLNLGLLSTTVLLVRRWLPALASTFPRFLFIAPLAFLPVAFSLMQGQDSVVTACVYCLTYGALRTRRDLQAGIWLGLGLFKFHLILPFAAILLLHRRWRAIRGILLSAGVEVAISWMVVGWKELLYYPIYVNSINRDPSLHVILPRGMPNLRGLFMGWAWSASARPWVEGLLLAVSAGLLIWASRYWRPQDLTDPQRWDDGFCLAVVTTFVVGYHGYSHDLSIVLLPILILLDRALQLKAAKFGGVRNVILVLMFFSPLQLVLNLNYDHQNLFALVLLALMGTLALSSAAATRPAWEDRATTLSSGRLA